MLDSVARLPPLPAEINRPPVEIFSVPHNGRCGVWPGATDALGEPLTCPPFTLLTLPVAMPAAIFVTTGPDGEPVAVDILDGDGGRIRREDSEWFLAHVLSFNRALGC